MSNTQSRNQEKKQLSYLTVSKDYAITIGRLMGRQLICFISRISNDRICVYVDSKQTSHKVLSNHSSITVANISTVIRSYISPSKWIILSNIAVCIPNDHADKFFIENNTEMNSKLTYLRAAIEDRSCLDF